MMFQNIAFFRHRQLAFSMKKNLTDQLNRKVSFDFPPKRIVSLVPSQTELLCYLGLEKEIVGITKFCVHPRRIFTEKEKIGGTKNLKPDKVAALKPDLVIGNKEENDKKQIETLATQFPVWMSDIRKLDDAFDMIARVGELTNRAEAATRLKQQLQNDFSEWAVSMKSISPKPAAYLIWRKPYMAVASDTFINEMMEIAGFSNVFRHLRRYPNLTLQVLANAAPEIILLSSEPYPFKEKHIAEISEFCPNAVIHLVDGEMFSWYGSRLLLAPRYFETLRKELW